MNNILRVAPVREHLRESMIVQDLLSHLCREVIYRNCSSRALLLVPTLAQTVISGQNLALGCSRKAKPHAHQVQFLLPRRSSIVAIGDIFKKTLQYFLMTTTTQSHTAVFDERNGTNLSIVIRNRPYLRHYRRLMNPSIDP